MNRCIKKEGNQWLDYELPPPVHYLRRYHQPRRRLMVQFDNLADAVEWLDDTAA
jgi:hypothetical protein|nr:MAG TPA: SpoIIAA-like protein [Caudoviricetes sp.]DAX56034.1 MAG TPA: SpoIIAA-like protein [Caudoviricetes sp.]